MKKLISLLLALVMILSLSTVAFAAGGEGVTEVTITKVYKLEGAGSSPAEDFELEVTSSSVSDSEATEVPALISISKASFAANAATDEGAEATFTITLPEYTRVGIYTYMLKEKNAGTAGVTYHDGQIKLVVTVVNGENGQVVVSTVHTESGFTGTTPATKSDSITNTYSAGTLNISKTVEGNLGDKDKYFNFEVTLNAKEGVGADKYASSFKVDGGSSAANNPTTIALGEKTTFKLKHGDTISIANLPYDVTYTVTEIPDDNYTTEVGEGADKEAGNVVTGTIAGAQQKAAFTNTRTGDVDTGVVLDTLPYVMILAVAAVCGMALLLKKRHMAD